MTLFISVMIGAVTPQEVATAGGGRGTHESVTTIVVPPSLSSTAIIYDAGATIDAWLDSTAGTSPQSDR